MNTANSILAVWRQIWTERMKKGGKGVTLEKREEKKYQKRDGKNEWEIWFDVNIIHIENINKFSNEKKMKTEKHMNNMLLREMEQKKQWKQFREMGWIS